MYERFKLLLLAINHRSQAIFERGCSDRLHTKVRLGDRSFTFPDSPI
ncbi:MAG: hypothetical protein ACM65M_13530 [Microcoleus sp.]